MIHTHLIWVLPTRSASFSLLLCGVCGVGRSVNIIESWKKLVLTKEEEDEGFEADGVEECSGEIFENAAGSLNR